MKIQLLKRTVKLRIDRHIAAAIVVHTCLSAIPLAITVRKSTDVFPFISYMVMGLCLVAALSAAGALL